jgi:hypothetical protein
MTHTETYFAKKSIKIEWKFNMGPYGKFT